MRSGLKVAACPPSAGEEEGIGCFLLFDLHFSEEALHISGSTTLCLQCGESEETLSCFLGAEGRKKGGPTTS